MERHWYRNRYVDPDHADTNFMCELARGVAVASKDRRAVAKMEDLTMSVEAGIMTSIDPPSE